MKRLILLVGLSTALWGCHSWLQGKPDCLAKALDSFQTWCCPNSAHIDAYTFQGQPVYVFEPGTCGADMPSYVVNAQCDTLGFLGGIAGFSQIQGVDFAANSSFQETIWKN